MIKKAFFCLGFFIITTLQILSQNINVAISSGRNDVVYLAPAIETYEAMPLGNGKLGVMLRNQNGLRYLFNHGAFFSSSNEAADLISSGELYIQLPDKWKSSFVDQRLVLYDGKIVTRYKNGSEELIVSSWLTEGSDALVVELASNSSIPEFSAGITGIDRSKPLYKPIGVSSDIKSRVNQMANASKGEVSLTTLGSRQRRSTSMVLRAMECEGINSTATNLEASMTVRPGKLKRITLITANPVLIGNNITTEQSLKFGQQTLEQIIKSGIQSTYDIHQQYWHNFWGKTSTLMQSEDGLAEYVENLYYLHLYWMAGCSRGQEAPKFNGANYIFNNDWRSWGGSYWYQNSRELYWPLLASGHSELFEPFVNLYWNNFQKAKQLSSDLYGLPGATYSETMDRTGGQDKGNNPYIALYHTTGVEIAYQFYQYYLYTRDETFLKQKVYPMLRETLTFSMNFLELGSDGYYHMYPSNARETYWWVKDAINDLCALHKTLPILISLSEKMNRDAESRVRWKHLLTNLAPLPIDNIKNEFAPCVFSDSFPPTPYLKLLKTYPLKNRSSSDDNSFNGENVSCEAAYPWGLLGLHSSTEDQERGKQTYLNRFFPTWCFENAWDWSPLYAIRLGLADEAVKAFQQFARYNQFYPSGMCGTPGFRPPEWGALIGDSPGFDGTGVLAASVNEMQLQSYNGLIRVYPAWPKGWTGRFSLIAEGGFEVNSSINKYGQIPSITINGRFPDTCSLVNPWIQGARLLEEGSLVFESKEAIIRFPAKPGKSYTLVPSSGTFPEVAISYIKNAGPKWPFHNGTDDKIENYMNRTEDFGMIGMSKEGSLARKLIQKGVKFKGRFPEKK